MKYMYKELGLNPKKSYMISFVGGGGKTSLMFSLANELKEFGNVIVTTTTKIRFPSIDQIDRAIMIEDDNFSVNDASSEGITLIGTKVNKDNKVFGVDSEFLDNIYTKGDYQFILVEADGAKEKPIKASNETEPIIPSKTDINIGIIGFDALDQKAYNVCFRLDYFKSITGKEPEDIIDDESVISLINHEMGLFKNTPENCKRFFVINKCDGEVEQKRAKELLDKAMSCKLLDRMFLSATRKNFFKRAYIDVCGIVMASGLSRRMGSNKLIMKINGEAMVERVVKECSLSHLKETIVVYNSEDVLNIIKDYPVKYVYNQSPEIGQSVSIKLGINELRCEETKGYMFLVSDQPFIKSSLINELLRNFKISYEEIVVPIYREKNGTPVIFPSLLKDEFNRLQGDSGGRDIIKYYNKLVKVNFEDSILGMDVDTPDEYEALRGMYNG